MERLRILNELERHERRVLAALRCVDATTGAPLDIGLRVEAPADARIRRNRSGLLVVHEWGPLADHGVSFVDAPLLPGVGSLTLTLGLSDPRGLYLPRIVRINLPRDADPSHTDEPDSVFRAVDVPMFPAGTARLGPNWAALSVSLFEVGSNDALGGVLLRVVSDGLVIARGLSDWRGEALVPVSRVPITTWSSGPGDVITTQIEASLEAFFDPASASRTALADVRAGRAPTALPQVDPVAIEDARAGLAQASVAVSLAAGRPLHVSLGIEVP
jgi:hypothetical protein